MKTVQLIEKVVYYYNELRACRIFVGVVIGSVDDADRWIAEHTAENQYRAPDGNLYPYYVKVGLGVLSEGEHVVWDDGSTSNSIKKELEDANRYKDVKTIITNIIKDPNLSGNYPVNPFRDEDGNTKWRVNGDLVKYEAYKLLSVIDGWYDEIDDITGKDFANLFQYITTESDRLLHSYVISLSHRHEPKIDMDVIRTWSIIDNMICHLDIHDINGEDDDRHWRIPEGWKRIDS